MIHQVASNGSEPRSSTGPDTRSRDKARQAVCSHSRQPRSGAALVQNIVSGRATRKRSAPRSCIILVKHRSIFGRSVCSVLIRTWCTCGCTEWSTGTSDLGGRPPTPKSRPRKAGPCVQSEDVWSSLFGAAVPVTCTWTNTPLHFISQVQQIRMVETRTMCWRSVLRQSKGRRRFAETPAADHVSMFTVFGCGHISFVT